MTDFVLGENATLGYDVTSGYREHMHAHWRQFPEPAYRTHVMVGIVMVIIGLIAITGNILTIFIFLRNRSLRTPSSILVINLAVSDCLMAATGYPLYAISSFHGYWAFPEIVCELYGFAGGLFGLLSINTMAAIAVDRYKVIMPLKTGVRSPSSRRSSARKMAAFAWVYSILLAIPPLFGWNRYILEGFGTTCSFDYLTRTADYTGFVLLMFFAGFVIPLLIIVYCYLYIFSKLFKYRMNIPTPEEAEELETDNKDERNSGRNSARNGGQSPARDGGQSPARDGGQSSARNGGRNSARDDAMTAAKRFDFQTAKVVFVCVLLYCVSWTPYAVVSLIGEFGDQSLIIPLASALPGIFAKASTMYNPFVYAIGHPRFKMKLKQWWDGDKKSVRRGDCLGGGRTRSEGRGSYDYISASGISRASYVSSASRCKRCRKCPGCDPMIMRSEYTFRRTACRSNCSSLCSSDFGLSTSGFSTQCHIGSHHHHFNEEHSRSGHHRHHHPRHHQHRRRGRKQLNLFPHQNFSSSQEIQSATHCDSLSEISSQEEPSLYTV